MANAKYDMQDMIKKHQNILHQNKSSYGYVIYLNIVQFSCDIREVKLAIMQNVIYFNFHKFTKLVAQ